ncbi:MAG: type I restriction enzyme HsdR N-terminal domain-containing protein [Muribaculaceae bacterium]|nr:type I restriction enzyme HsdR N-terminal domain-containing protein [Muribaculaceae bacterium]
MSQPLNLPSFRPTVRPGSGDRFEVFDPLRRRWVTITPEEEVRQTFVNYLTAHLGYPAALMANEHSLTLNGTARRCDTVVFTQALRPLMIVEYKRPTVALTAKVFDQIARYNSVLGAPWLVVSNGLHHFCCRFNGSGYTFHDRIPLYSEL